MHRVHCVVGALKTGPSLASETQRGGSKGERAMRASESQAPGAASILHYGWSGNVKEESKVHSP